ncbi:hypothetical protein C8Q72DRAFT_372104 [Fomitopsis betulina]|nr:hypothetical protein C8Q72DRAFT_372104 [Fomitopsis betulina]
MCPILSLRSSIPSSTSPTPRASELYHSSTSISLLPRRIATFIGFSGLWPSVTWVHLLVFNWRNTGHIRSTVFSLRTLRFSICLHTRGPLGRSSARYSYPSPRHRGSSVSCMLACWAARLTTISTVHITASTLVSAQLYHTCMLSHSGISASYSPAHAGFACANLRCTTKISIDAK